MSPVNSVAVACRGGGSHTAFGGGALSHLFGELSPDDTVEAADSLLDDLA